MEPVIFINKRQMKNEELYGTEDSEETYEEFEDIYLFYVQSYLESFGYRTDFAQTGGIFSSYEVDEDKLDLLEEQMLGFWEVHELLKNIEKQNDAYDAYDAVEKLL